VARFYSDKAAVASELRTDQFVLRPLSVRHNPLDYEAVVASQEQLRLGSTHGWPRAGFTPEENLEDLRKHEQEFAERKAFVYTVLDPSETQCLGCVYIYPRERVLRHHRADAAALAAVGDDEAEVTFWVRTDRLSDDLRNSLDRRLLDALRPWLRERFAFASVHIGALARERRHVALLQAAGLRAVARYPVDGTEYLSFE
jgi:hypothetical protein